MKIRTFVLVSVFGIMAFLFVVDVVLAQQATVGAPLIGNNNSFYENYNLHWGFHGHGFFFDNGGGGALPPFGGFDPNAQAQAGFGTVGRNGGLFFGLSAGQGNTSSITSSTPMITLQNGVPGAIYDTSLRPFVIGVVPVVGNNVQMVNPLVERVQRIKAGETPATSAAYPRTNRTSDDLRLASSKAEPTPVRDNDSAASSASAATSTANRGDLSVSEIRRLKAQEDAANVREIEALIEQARGQEELGKPGQAKIYYQKAARRATGEQQRQLERKIRELSANVTSSH